MTPTISQSLNILIVDDEVNIRKTLSVCLETEGHKAIAVSNFQDVLAEASRWSFEPSQDSVTEFPWRKLKKGISGEC
jgi:CheY-like chemotaxis protein